MKETLFSLNFELLAQIADIDFDDITFTTEIIAPHPVKNHLPGQYLAWVAQEQLQVARILWR